MSPSVTLRNLSQPLVTSRNLLQPIVTFLLLLLCVSCTVDRQTRILVITGGHDFDRPNFMEMFSSQPNLLFYEVTQPEANNLYASDSIDQFDALVFYDMVQEISEEQKAAFLDLLERGMGMVFIHHSIASYQTWDEFKEILGARYHLEPWVRGGDSLPASTYNHDVDLEVQVADDQHPVTTGLSDFVIHDETYDLVEILPNRHPLLTTSQPGSMPLLGWAHRYGNSRIVYLQPGHDNNAYSHAGYRQLVMHAIDWVKR